MDEKRKPYVPPEVKIMPIEAIAQQLGRDELLCHLAERLEENYAE